MATWVKLTLAIKTGIPFLARLLRQDEKNLYALFDEIVRKFFPQSVLNEFIIKDDELLSQRVKRDVTSAVDSYNEATTTPIINEPTQVEAQPDGSNAQSLLGGEIGLKASWTTQETNGL